MKKDFKKGFKKNLSDLKQLEARAKETRNDMDIALAEYMRTNMMSYGRMTRKVLVVAAGKSPEFQKHVREAIDQGDVEEIYRLCVRYCDVK